MWGGLYGIEDLEDVKNLGLVLYMINEYKKLGVERMLEIIYECVGEGFVFLLFDIDFLDLVYVLGMGMFEVLGVSIDDVF